MFSRFIAKSTRSAVLISVRDFAKNTGTVKFFDPKKGFGFITVAETGEDIFVHHSAINTDGFRSLADGEEVEFSITLDENRGKKNASDVTGPNGAPVKGAPRVDPRPSGDNFRRGGRDNDFN